jgi:hypothetical protein
VGWTDSSQKKEVQIANKYMKNYSTSLTMKEMQTRTTLGFLPVGMVIIKEANALDLILVVDLQLNIFVKLIKLNSSMGKFYCM